MGVSEQRSEEDTNEIKNDVTYEDDMNLLILNVGKRQMHKVHLKAVRRLLKIQEKSSLRESELYRRLLVTQWILYHSCIA